MTVLKYRLWQPWNKRIKTKGNFEFMFQNSYIFLTIPRLYLTVLIRKINSSFSLFPLTRNHEFISHISGFLCSQK